MPNPKDGKLELLSDKTAHSSSWTTSPRCMPRRIGNKTIIRNAAYCAAKAASILGVPVVLSSINPQSNGNFLAEVTNLFPGQQVYARTVPELRCFRG